MRPRFLQILLILLFPSVINAQEKNFDNSPIFTVDLNRYLGTWYEIARMDHVFERGMDNVTAVYTLRDDGMINVVNSGWKKGRFKQANGKARQPEPLSDPAHLEVSFFLSFFNDYNILMLDPDYKVVLVGSNSPKYLWILARDPKVSDAVLGDFLEEADLRGYDISSLIWVDQSKNL